MKKILSVVVLISLVTLISCNDDEPAKKEKVAFSLTTENILNSLGNTQDPLNVESVKAVLVTVSNENGKVVLNNKKLSLSLQDGNFITEPVKLKAGEYSITAFQVVDDADNITFETPLEGSSASELVSDALPIIFEISEDDEEIEPQVLSITESIGFKLGVYTFNSVSENFEISGGDIEVTSGEEVVADRTLSAATTQVDVEKLDSYTVTISKSGYIPVIRSFTLSELQAYASQALYVRLYAESTASNLVVYYPFSGNINDASGHVTAGVNEGAVLVSDQYGNFNSSYSFDGFTQHINLGNILDDVSYPFTVAVWVKPGDHTGRPYNTIFTSQDNAPLYNGFDIHISHGTSIGVAIGDGRGENNGAYGRFKSATISDRTGLWTHVAAVVTSNDNMKLYLNGVEVDGSYAGSTTFSIDSNFPTDVARLGRWTSNGNTYYYTGSADEFRVWKRALTPLEIKSSM